jgi:hypothetical protein
MAGSKTLKAFLKEGGSAVVPLLKTIDAASGIFPPLKNAVSIALIIGNLVAVCFHVLISRESVQTGNSEQDFKSNKKDWAKFGQFVQDALGSVVQSLPNTSEPREDIRSHLRKLEKYVYRDINITSRPSACTLKRALEKTRAHIITLQAKQRHVRLWTFFKDPGEILGMRKDIEDAIALFQVPRDHMSAVIYVK